jgi:hypothetical protein
MDRNWDLFVRLLRFVSCTSIGNELYRCEKLFENFLSNFIRKWPLR